MELLAIIFWAVYVATVLFVGVSFTLHLNTSRIETSQLLMMVFLGLCPVLNTILLIISFTSRQTLLEMQRELEELEKRNRKD